MSAVASEVESVGQEVIVRSTPRSVAKWRPNGTLLRSVPDYERILRYAFITLAVAGLLALLAVPARADGPVAVQAAVEPDTITVGDRVRLTVRATHPPTLTVDFPRLAPEWDGFAVLDQHQSPPKKADGQMVSVMEYTVTAFSVGQHATLPLKVHYQDGQGHWGAVEVAPVTVTVTSVLTGTGVITDILGLKPQAGLPPDWRWLRWVGLAWAVLALIAAALIFLLLRWRRRTAAEAPVALADPRPPEEIAYAELERIEALALVPQGRYKEHYTLTADCLRRYAEGRYGIPAMDRTTAEFVTALRQARTDGGHVRLFQDVLAESDLVKFAKFIPPAEEAGRLVARARYIVDVTKPIREEPETETSSDLRSDSSSSR